MEIRVIKPKCKTESRKLRVCAYCRVSTAEEEQANSLENQVSHYTDVIQADPRYEFAGVYHDYAISGFKEDRPGFQAMLEAARERKIDLIITKSVSRFCRNTDTLLKAVRELKGLGVGILFELQRINTLTETGEVMLTVLAAFAQAESENYRTLGQMVYRRKYEAGIPVYYLEKSFGYTRDEAGKLIPDRDEAPWVKKIFELYAAGYNLAQVARHLNDQGVTTKAGASFTESTVVRILENEIYIGDYVMHKHYVNEERREVRNRGEVDAWYVKNDHVPLVSHKLWKAAQERLKERREYLATKSVVGELKEEAYPYMDRVFCAECGYPLYRRVYSKGNRVCWCCGGQKRFTKTFCRGLNVPDSVIRSWGDWSGNIYIRRETDQLGKSTFKYVKESTWKKDHSTKRRTESVPALTEENYPYRRHLFCAECGSRLTRHIQTTAGKIFWICSGNKHKGSGYCSGVRVPDNVVRGWGDINRDIHIRKDGKDGERGYRYSSKKDGEVQSTEKRAGRSKDKGGSILPGIDRAG